MKSVLIGTAACLALVAALCLSACKCGGASPRDPARAIAGNWSLDWLQGTGPVSQETYPPTLNIAPDGQVGGFTGVNRLSSSLDTAALARAEFFMRPAASTRMAGPPEAMAMEARYLDALGRASRYLIDGDHLVLSDASQELLRFARK